MFFIFQSYFFRTLFTNVCLKYSYGIFTWPFRILQHFEGSKNELGPIRWPSKNEVPLKPAYLFECV